MIGPDRCERTADREANRAGHYERGFTTTSGQLTLKMPKWVGRSPKVRKIVDGT